MTATVVLAFVIAGLACLALLGIVRTDTALVFGVALLCPLAMFFGMRHGPTDQARGDR